MDEQLIQQFISMINDPSVQSGQQAAPTGQAGLQPFFDTPMYQLLYGENANQINPTERFRADPGYEFAQEEAFKKLQQYGAARGLLESGPLQVELQKQAQGMADQNYQRWLGQQAGAYTDYQDRLAGLAQMGAGQTGADQYAQIGATLAPLLGGYNISTGQNIGQANLGVGQDIASLLANQGVFGANAMLNTGAAKANALMQAFGINAQQQNAQMASNAQTVSSLLGGQAQLQGAQIMANAYKQGPGNIGSSGGQY